MPNNPTITASSSSVAGKDRGAVTTTAPALAAAFLGLFFIWGVGFSHIDAIHNAAHDTRHSNAFPCH